MARLLLYPFSSLSEAYCFDFPYFDLGRGYFLLAWGTCPTFKTTAR